MNGQTKNSSPITVLFAWLFVCIPAAWGVSQTFHKSMSLFVSQPPPATRPAQGP